MVLKQSRKKRKTLRRRHRRRRYKRRTRRRRTRLKQRGGMNIRITDTMIDNWQNPHNLANDCCPCVFSLLGMPHNIANALAMSHLQGMVSFKEITHLFSQYYPNYTFSSHEIPVTPKLPLKTIITHLYDNTNIPPGTATVGGFWRTAGLPGARGHCIVWAKSLAGQPILLDAQMGLLYKGYDAILSYLQKNHAAIIVLIKGVSKINGAPLSINNQDGHSVQSIQQNHVQFHTQSAP